MKRILFIFMAIFIPVMVMANCNSIQHAASNMTIEGFYNTSAYDGTYRLLEDNGFPKRACVVGVHLNSLPEGYHYSWKIIKGYGDEVLQVQSGTTFAYIGQNGDTDVLELSISIIDESTGYSIMSRNIRFVFIEGFTKPIVPPIG